MISSQPVSALFPVVCFLSTDLFCRACPGVAPHRASRPQENLEKRMEEAVAVAGGNGNQPSPDSDERQGKVVALETEVRPAIEHWDMKRA